MFTKGDMKRNFLGISKEEMVMELTMKKESMGRKNKRMKEEINKLMD